MDRNHRTVWLLFINASLLGWKIIFLSTVLNLVRRLNQTPQSFQAPTRMWQESKMCFGDILHPVRNGPHSCLQPSSLSCFHCLSHLCGNPAGIPALRKCRASMDCLNLPISGEKDQPHSKLESDLKFWRQVKILQFQSEFNFESSSLNLY